MPAFLARAIGLLLGLLVPLGYAEAQKSVPKPEPATTFFWGIQRGCERDRPLSKAAASRLHAMGEGIVSVGPELVKRSPGCLGEDCLRAFQSVCTKRTGSLLGGTVTQREVVSLGGETETWYLLRLWRSELGGGKTAYLQHVCRSCDLATELSRLVTDFVEHPPTEVLTAKEVQSSRMPFCAAERAEEAPAPREQRIAVVVSGVRDAKAARTPLLRALKDHLAQTGREVVRAEVARSKDDASVAPTPDLSSFVAKKQVNDVFGVELQAEGQVRVRLMNGATLTTAENSIDCLGCSEDALVRRVILAAGPLLDRCIGADCPVDIPMTQLRWTENLCLPSAEPSCAASGVPAALPTDEKSVNTMCGAFAEGPAFTVPHPDRKGEGGSGAPVPPAPRLSKGRIVGASLLGAAALGAFITAAVFTAQSGQPAGDGCTSVDGLRKGGCSYPVLTAAYAPMYAAGALLLGGGVLTLWPVFKHEPPKSVVIKR